MPYLVIKPAKVDEPRAGEIPRIAVVNAQDRVQSECRDHGGKELEGDAAQSYCQMPPVLLPHHVPPPTTPNRPPRPLRRAWYPWCGGDKRPRSLWQHSGQLTPTQGSLLLLPLCCPGAQPKAAPLERSWEQDGAQPGPNSAPEDQGTEGELGCCSQGCITHSCPAGAEMAGGLGL